ncbi:elongation of very long chain fatty acids protein 6-like isoform X1 [Neoarius graeffei]|uniref:elongation of very long chain fatty acids protein 6-like isoform X1 n=1 Tax=Neoarius graeffei TaxID=443677 RepID=UPI00298C3EFD|nr:elongation of very long chain fatty acids protein 6-like isoform X1 [Neoarius graeffei]
MNGTLFTGYFDFERRFDEKVAFKWFEENWTVSFVLCALYAVVIFLGRSLMRDRQKLDLRVPLALWSLSLAVFSIIGTVRTGSYMLHLLGAGGFRQTVCDTSFYSAPIIKFWAYAFVLSKVPEFGDTVFIVLRKQRLMFLHWYHHITVLLYSWYTYRERAAGGCWFITMNYTVHSLMYSYYAAKAAGLHLPRPCAMIITALQTLQMALGLTVLVLVYRWQNDAMCRSTDSNITWGLLMYFSYLLLFASFFYQSYVKGGKKDMAGERRVKSE